MPEKNKSNEIRIIRIYKEVETFIKARSGMTLGWTGSFDKLDAHLANQ